MKIKLTDFKRTEVVEVEDKSLQDLHHRLIRQLGENYFENYDYNKGILFCKNKCQIIKISQ